MTCPSCSCAPATTTVRIVPSTTRRRPREVTVCPDCAALLASMGLLERRLAA